MMTGYLHPSYVESLSEFGKPRLLPKSGGWILKRQIPGTIYQDGMGCYPLFTCQDWSQLYSDMEDIKSELVSLAIVTDPFGAYTIDYLQQCFRDVVIPFKEHFVVDLSRPMNTFVSYHHRRYAQKALQNISIERCSNPQQFLNEWIDLYNFLIQRHHIKGIPAFSRLSFVQQMKIPGLFMFRAVYKEITVGMVLWYIQGNVSYYHLGAYSDLGYKLRASFALFWYVIKYFASVGLEWLSLGAGTGVKANHMDGLTRFKRGWSTATRTAYFCGRIFNHKQYLEIIEAKNLANADYFPAYRKGEFG